MATTVGQLFSKQRQASASDLRECGWLQTQFPESFGSGGVLGLEIGSDGHLWVIIPINEPSAETAARGAGVRKSVRQIIPQHDPNGWKLHAKFYKFARGFWKPSAWVGSIQLSNSRQMITLGFIATTSVRQFAVDLRQMLDLGIPTFETAPEAFEAVP
jgi:hypothetical protein